MLSKKGTTLSQHRPERLPTGREKAVKASRIVVQPILHLCMSSPFCDRLLRSYPEGRPRGFASGLFGKYAPRGEEDFSKSWPRPGFRDLPDGDTFAKWTAGHKWEGCPSFNKPYKYIEPQLFGFDYSDGFIIFVIIPNHFIP